MWFFDFGSGESDAAAPEIKQTQVAMIGWVLRLRVNGNRAPKPLALGFDQVDHLLQGRNLEFAVVLLRALGVCGDNAEGLYFGKREVMSEPAALQFTVYRPVLALAACEFGPTGNVGAYGQIGVMAGDQHAVLGGDQVKLDRIGAKVDCSLIGLEGVFRQVARSTAMGDHQRFVTVQRWWRQWRRAAAAGNLRQGHQT